MRHGRMKTGRIAAVNGLLFMAALALCPAVSRAECRSWDVSGSWFLQGAGDFYTFHLTQNGIFDHGPGYEGPRSNQSDWQRHGLGVLSAPCLERVRVTR